MWEQTISLGVETSAWLTKNGVILMPVEYPGGQKNTGDGSDNKFYKITSSGKKQFVHYNGKRIELSGQIHTHPRDGNFSGNDKEMMFRLGGKPVYAFGSKNLYRGVYSKIENDYISSAFGNAMRLRNGKIKLL